MAYSLSFLNRGYVCCSSPCDAASGRPRNQPRGGPMSGKCARDRGPAPPRLGKSRQCRPEKQWPQQTDSHGNKDCREGTPPGRLGQTSERGREGPAHNVKYDKVRTHDATVSVSPMITIGGRERPVKAWHVFAYPLPTYKSCSARLATRRKSQHATRAIREYRCRTDRLECVWRVLRRSGRARMRRSCCVRFPGESNGAVRQIG
jgi:hypothetical protein